MAAVAVFLAGGRPVLADKGLAEVVARYNGPASGSDFAYDVATSADGSRVFVTGLSGGSSNYEFATIGYDVVSRQQEWVARLAAPPGTNAQAHVVAVSGDGGRVFVAGYTNSTITNKAHSVLVAYDSATGSQEWIYAKEVPPEVTDQGPWMSVDPAGLRVYVATSVNQQGGGRDYATEAIDARSGRPLWISKYTGPGHNFDDTRAIGVSPDGAMVYVTGSSYGITTFADAATVAYDPLNGAQEWVRRYDGPDHESDVPYALGVSPDSRGLFVTGDSFGKAATLMYRLDGTLRWAALHGGPDFGGASARALALAPDGSRVFITGTFGIDYGTLAYDATSGSQLWEARYDGPADGFDVARDIGLSSDGRHVYVTGASDGYSGFYDYATVAYDPSTGRQLAVNRYNGPRNRKDEANALAVNPVNSQVYVTGYSDFSASAHEDYLTIAYSMG